MSKFSGEMEVEGTTALVSQTAFILNDTVRENILFASEYDEERYSKVQRSFTAC